MADGTDTTTDPGTSDTSAAPSVDLAAFVPESFKGEDGAWNTAGFRTSYDELAAFKAQADERAAALPKEAKDYAWAVPEGHQFPEGFDPKTLATKDEQGNEIAFDVSKMVDPNDPDVPALQAILHEAGVDPAVMGKLASVMANRTIREMTAAMKAAGEQKQALGPQGQARIDTVSRTLAARLPAAQAQAILNGVTSADALRGLEAILGRPGATTPPAGGGNDLSSLPPLERLIGGLKQRSGA